MNQEIDIHHSHEAAQRIKTEPQACWRNTILAQQHFPETHYIEGWAVSPDGLVIEPGWLEQDNKVIDPTLISRIEEKEESPAYFLGFAIRRKGRSKRLTKQKDIYRWYVEMGTGVERHHHT